MLSRLEGSDMHIDQIDKTACTGCHACLHVCTYNAITMEFSEDGFLYPNINFDKCKNCGRCYNVCPVKSTYLSCRPLKCLSCYSCDGEVIKKSSSGGVFYHLASNILSAGGLVVGAAYSAEEHECKHLSTDSIQLESLMKSKYVQSRIGNSYNEAAYALKNHRPVLFCGTPCQIRGLKSYLRMRRIEGALLTVDFMCHGVPSPGLFKKFLDRMEKIENSSITNITFREKDMGWKTQVVKTYFADGNTVKQLSME